MILLSINTHKRKDNNPTANIVRKLPPAPASVSSNRSEVESKPQEVLSRSRHASSMVLVEKILKRDQSKEKVGEIFKILVTV
jgi:hypothetical protein